MVLIFAQFPHPFLLSKSSYGSLGGSSVSSSRTLSTAYSVLAKILVAAVASEANDGGAVLAALGKCVSGR